MLILYVGTTSSLIAQSKIGIELKTSYRITGNASALHSMSTMYTLNNVIEQKNTISEAYEIGFFYNHTKRMKFKFLIGSTYKGLLLTAEIYNDLPGFRAMRTFQDKTHFIQFTPLMSYDLIYGKIKIPIEVGITFNSIYKDFYNQYHDNKLVFSRKYHMDLRLSTGFHYYDFEMIEIGINIIYAQSFTNYLTNKFSYDGDFIPYQLGAELAIQYTIN